MTPNQRITDLIKRLDPEADISPKFSSSVGNRVYYTDTLRKLLPAQYYMPQTSLHTRNEVAEVGAMYKERHGYKETPVAVYVRLETGLILEQAAADILPMPKGNKTFILTLEGAEAIL